jgi:hypothetical protein
MLVTLRSGGSDNQHMLVGPESPQWDGARIAVVGHGGEPEVLIDQMQALCTHLQEQEGQRPAKLALLSCDAASCLDEGGHTLLDNIHAVFTESGLSIEMSAYDGGIQVGEEGRRYAAHPSCRKLTLEPQEDGSIRRNWQSPKRIGGEPGLYLGGRGKKGKKQTQALNRARDEKAQVGQEDEPETTKMTRRNVGRFLSPSKNAIKHFKATPIGKAIRQRLSNSDLAHRMSFEDIRRCVEDHEMDDPVVEKLIRTLTIPSRDFGGIRKGDMQYHDYVRDNIRDKPENEVKGVLIELLNSSPYNLRPGDAAENRSIGKSLDPNLSASGKKTPLSQSVDTLGKEHPGVVSPAKEFDEGKSRHPDNVDPEAMPEHRSSTSLTAEQMRAYETSAIKSWSKSKPRKYCEGKPFQSGLGQSTRG